MMTYMREGGFNMWLLLAVAIGTVVLAFVRPREQRAKIFHGGCIACLISGLFGLAAGMEAVSAHYGRFDDPTAALGQGLGELANNGSFAAVLALLLGIGLIVTARGSQTRSRSAPTWFARSYRRSRRT